MTGEAEIRNEELEKLLLATLQRTIDFLKFAEAKNGALITFSSAWIIAIINLASKNAAVFSPTIYEDEILIPFVIACLSSLLSFLPRMNLPRFLGGRRAGPHRKNLLYFGDIGTMTVLEFERAIRDDYLSKTADQLTKYYIKDLSVQVFVNSQITTYKLKCFRFGLFCIAAGLFAMAMTALKLSVTPWLVS